MGRYLWRALVLAALITAVFTVGAEKDAAAEVRVDVNIGLPSPFVFHAPPPVVVVPGTYVYLVPDVDVSILFYHGAWYRPHGGHWYRSRSYNGPWARLAIRHVPRALTKLPPHYRSVPRGYHRIPYGQMKRNWGRWEREKHWSRDKAWRTGWEGHGGNGGAQYEHGRDSRGRPEGVRGREGDGGRGGSGYGHGGKGHGRSEDGRG